MAQLDDQAQTRMAMAALFVALVRTLPSQDGGARKKAETELERVFHKLRDFPADWSMATETLRWAQEMLRDDS